MTLLPARYQCTPSSTRVPRASIWISRRGSSPTSIRTALASSWSTKASSVTAGSSIGSSFRKRRTSAINSFLEGVEADAAIGVDEALAGVAQLAIALDRALDRVDDAVLVEAGAGDLGLRRVLRARSAEPELVIFGALAVDAQAKIGRASGRERVCREV